MRSAGDCLIKAADMERRAWPCATLDLNADLLAMAQVWRRIAQQALWQDVWSAPPPPLS